MPNQQRTDILIQVQEWNYKSYKFCIPPAIFVELLLSKWGSSIYTKFGGDRWSGESGIKMGEKWSDGMNNGELREWSNGEEAAVTMDVIFFYN